MAFHEVTHDEIESQKFRNAAIILARLRKYQKKIKGDEWHTIRRLALEGQIDAAEDALVFAVTGEKREKINKFPVKIGKVR